jgi:hypothetical protein
MRHQIIAAALLLSTTASAQTVVADPVAELRTRIQMCSLIVDTALQNGIKESDLIDRVLASDKLTDAQKAALLETCIAFTAGRVYETALRSPRA